MFITTTFPWKSASLKVLLSSDLIGRSSSVSGKKVNSGGPTGSGGGSGSGRSGA